jgi:transcriptional regulator with XRE-family HTH domain
MVRKLGQNLVWGRKLRQIRLSRKLTLTKLGEKTGIDPSNLNRLEQGRWDMRVSTLACILGALRCTLVIKRRK